MTEALAPVPDTNPDVVAEFHTERDGPGYVAAIADVPPFSEATEPFARSRTRGWAALAAFRKWGQMGRTLDDTTCVTIQEFASGRPSKESVMATIERHENDTGDTQ